MPYFNYYLDTDLEEINKEELLKISKEVSDTPDTEGVYRCDPVEPKWTNSQLKALRLILCNLVRYPNLPILYSRRHQATKGKRFNPQQIGNKIIKAVMDKLEEAKLIKHETGDNIFKHTDENSPAHLSEIISNAAVIDLARGVGIIESNISMDNPNYIILRQTGLKGGKSLEFKDNWYTIHIQELMKEYCEFLNEQRIVVEDTGELFRDIVLRRTYRDRDDVGSFLYGGRSGGFWMDIKKKHRGSITINRQPTVELDFNACTLNVLHRFKYGSWFPEDDDGYEIEGVSRELVKLLVTRCMLNSDSRRQSTARFKAMTGEGDHAILKEMSKLSVTEMVNAVEKKHEKLQGFFYAGEDMAQHYAWLESNVVFGIALQATRSGIPCLTTHDSFRVPKEDEGVMQMVMYGTHIDELYTKHCLF